MKDRTDNGLVKSACSEERQRCQVKTTMVLKDILRLFVEFDRNPPVDAIVVQRFAAGANVYLPDEYVEFLQEANGGEGFIGKAYVVLWRVEELLEYNNGYLVSEAAPGLFLFGSNGGGEGFGFDMRTDAKPIVCVPFIGMEWNVAIPVALNFADFLEIIQDGIPWPRDGASN